MKLCNLDYDAPITPTFRLVSTCDEILSWMNEIFDDKPLGK
jgi:hypothetical protein